MSHKIVCALYFRLEKRIIVRLGFSVIGFSMLWGVRNSSHCALPPYSLLDDVLVRT